MHKNHTFTQTKHIGNHDMQAKDIRFFKKFSKQSNMRQKESTKCHQVLFVFVIYC